MRRMGCPGDPVEVTQAAGPWRAKTRCTVEGCMRTIPAIRAGPVPVSGARSRSDARCWPWSASGTDGADTNDPRGQRDPRLGSDATRHRPGLLRFPWPPQRGLRANLLDSSAEPESTSGSQSGVTVHLKPPWSVWCVSSSTLAREASFSGGSCQQGPWALQLARTIPQPADPERPINRAVRVLAGRAAVLVRAARVGCARQRRRVVEEVRRGHEEQARPLPPSRNRGCGRSSRADRRGTCAAASAPSPTVSPHTR